MDLQQEQIKEQFGAFAAKYGPAALLTATVTAVNDDDTVAIEFSEGGTVDDARLKALVKAGNKVLLIPAVDSKVLVGRIENSDEYVVIVADEITEVKTVIDAVEYSVTDAGFLIKKGADTLRQVLTDIVDAVLPIVVIIGNNPDHAKLLATKIKINNLLR